MGGACGQSPGGAGPFAGGGGLPPPNPALPDARAALRVRCLPEGAAPPLEAPGDEVSLGELEAVLEGSPLELANVTAPAPHTHYCVERADGNWTSFIAQPPAGNTSLVFWGGGLVESDAYAPLMRAAVQGFGVRVAHLLDSPGGIPQPAVEAARALIDRERTGGEIGQWIFAGHSMGSVMATKAALSDDLGAAPGEVALAFLGGYPAPDDQPALAAAVDAGNLTVAFVTASEDGIINATNLAAAEAALRGEDESGAETISFEIPGGNHAGFGNYRVDFELRPDGQASIPPEEQQDAALEALAVLGLIPGRPGMAGADFTGR